MSRSAEEGPGEAGLSSRQEIFRKRVLRPAWMRLYLLKELPMAFLAGACVTHLDRNRCSVSIPFKWLTKNPFASTYFACLSMAAEMSTGLLSLMAVEGRKPSVAMIIVDMRSEFVKKAVGLTTFTCEDGDGIFEAVEKSVRTGEGVVVEALSVGRDDEGNDIARFRVSWSFRQRKQKKAL